MAKLNWSQARKVGKKRVIKARTTKAKANKALREVKQLKKLVNKTLENKHCDFVTTNLSVSTSPLYGYSFLRLKQGTQDDSNVNSADYDARIGNSVTLMNERLNFLFSPPVTGTITEAYNRIRCILVESLDGNQNLVLSDILKYSNYGVHGDMVFASPYTTKSNTNSRYKILMDRCFELNPNGGNATKIIKHRIKHGKSGRVINFNDNAEYPVDYNITLMIISDSASAAHPVCNYSYRATFKDA